MDHNKITRKWDPEADMKWFIQHPSKGHFKALPSLRVMIFGLLIIMLMAYSLIYFAGGYLYYNGGISNYTLATQYNAIKAGTPNPGGLFSNTSGLNSQLQQQGQSFQNAGLLTDLVNTLTTVASFFGTLVPGLNAVLFYMGSVFAFFGIPVAYFEAIGTLMFVALLIITIITIWSIVYT